MTPHYLKFPDEATAIAVLSTFRGVDDGGVACWNAASHTHSLDVMGTYYTASGNMLTGPMGIQYPEMVPTPGFHINLRGDLPAEALQYEIFPATPSRVWA